MGKVERIVKIRFTGVWLIKVDVLYVEKPTEREI